MYYINHLGRQKRVINDMYRDVKLQAYRNVLLQDTTHFQIIFFKQIVKKFIRKKRKDIKNTS
jgi:hypothetical protein